MYTPLCSPFRLAFSHSSAHRHHVRAILLTLLLGVPGWADDAFGTWTVNPVRSTSAGDPHPRAVSVRIERHAKGEVFTLDQIREKGEKVTISMILYLDGKEREFQGDTCFGTQSSRRVDRRTVEIVYRCRDRWTRWIRRLPQAQSDLILDITEHLSDGRRFERRLVLEKQ
jgi:hypothetical protein